jgi:polyisoprenoid-binding protein YceI
MSLDADAVNQTESVLPEGQWSIDHSRSSVAFSLKHMLVATVKGSFHEFEGDFSAGADGISAGGIVKSVSIDTGDQVRDEVLRSSADFFDVEHHPDISFRSTAVEPLGKGRVRIRGELEMRGIVREIELSGRVRHDPGDQRIELEVRGEIERAEFGLSWNQTLDAGGVLLGNKVKIALDISAVRGPVST